MTGRCAFWTSSTRQAGNRINGHDQLQRFARRTLGNIDSARLREFVAGHAAPLRQLATWPPTASALAVTHGLFKLPSRWPTTGVLPLAATFSARGLVRTDAGLFGTVSAKV